MMHFFRSSWKPWPLTYYLVERSKVDELYRAAGHQDDSAEVPNFITVDGKECLFTENFVEKDGKEYEIVMVANGFSWEDIMVYDEDGMCSDK